MIPDRLERLVSSGVLAGPLLVFAVLALTVGTLWTVGSGRVAARLLLLAGAVTWPLPDRPYLGPVIAKVSYAHGLHLTDLVSVAAVGLVVLRPWRVRAGRASSGR